MPIILRLDRVMADRKMSLNELSDRVGISNVNMSHIKTGKIKAIRFSTLEMICATLECQPGDILEYAPQEEEEASGRAVAGGRGKEAGAREAGTQESDAS